MASPVPLLRPPVPGAGRAGSANKLPRLGLAIPASPSQRPVNSAAAPPMLDNPALPPLSIPRAQPPKLSLATPMGTSQTPQESTQSRRRGPALTLNPGQSASSGDDSAHSRTNSFGNSANPNGSISTTSSLDFIDVLRGKEPESAYAGSRESESERLLVVLMVVLDSTMETRRGRICPSARMIRWGKAFG
jgi:mitogen-activated protein kinase kinase